LRLKRWIWISLVLAAVVAAVLYGFRPQPARVEVVRARRDAMQVSIQEEGRTRVTDRFVVSAPIAGYLRRIRLKEGDTVVSNQVVATLEPLRPAALDPRSRAQAEAQVAAAQSSVAAAREQVRAAQTNASYWEGELGRIEKLVKSGDMARERYDSALAEERRARAALEEAEQRVKVAEAEVRSAKAALQITPAERTGESMPVRAPVDGRVLKVVRESEGVVNAGEPLLELGTIRSLEVLVELLSADAVRVTPGMRVIFTRWGGDQPLEGRVRVVEPQAFTKISALGVEEQRVNVISDITSPRSEWQNLGAGYRVEAAFVLWQEDKVLQIPSSALFRHEDGWAVFTVQDDTARLTQVQVGRRNGLSAQILSGVSENMAVIPHPDPALTDGTKVTLAAGT
jgi:HlyD family secretion protein